MTCQRRFTDCNRRITVMWDVNSGRGYLYVGTRVMGDLTSIQFFCEPKTYLKTKVY